VSLTRLVALAFAYSERSTIESQPTLGPSERRMLYIILLIIRMAVNQLHKSKAFKAKEALKAKKQRNAARWKKGKKEGKRKQHAKKFAKPKEK